MPAKILVVDDDPAIRRLLRNTLLRAHYEVIEASTAKEALRSTTADCPNAVMLDLGLPDRDGLSVIPLLRQQTDAVILVVSARDEVDEKVSALDLGADDFLTKPFDTEELLARLRVALRHRSSVEIKPVVFTRGSLIIDNDRQIVSRDGNCVHLTKKERAVLETLSNNAGRIVTHERLLQAGWTASEDPRIEYLRIVIRNLRSKLENPDQLGSLIASELGIGYRMLCE